jgi:hypothetical protein
MEFTHPGIEGGENTFELKDVSFLLAALGVLLLKPAETGRGVPLISYRPIRTTRKE